MRPTRALIVVLAVALATRAAAQSADEPPVLRVTSVTPAGDGVPPGRQIVVQFNRPVVPIGRMDREGDELPITIEPALACDWRWIDTSALACQLGDGESFRPATRYALTIGANLAADDGSTLGADVVARFTTERPRVDFAQFRTWRAPDVPVIRAIFNQPVSRDSVAGHLYFTDDGGRRIAIAVEPEPGTRELPRFMPLPGELAFVDFGERQTVESEDAREGRVEARRVWLVTPEVPLGPAVSANLVVEPGLESAEGPLPGDETRIVVAFDVFPEFRFLGVVCRTNFGDEQTITSDNRIVRNCNPIGPIGLAFSAPVIAEEIRDHVVLTPDLAGGRSDYDPWANVRSFSQLGRPHRQGQRYVVWLPERLRAAEPYRLGVPAGDAGPRDEFGRALATPLALDFGTDHRPPNFAINHPLAVIESGIDAEVPLYVTNLESARVSYGRVTPAGSERGRVQELALADVEDVQYAVPFAVREMLDGGSGVIYGELQTTPSLPRLQNTRSLFAQVTPWQVHAKFGHFNTLVWVTELATGEPVRDARVTIYVDRLVNLSNESAAVDAAVTDRDGVALLAGAEALDPELELTAFSCGLTNRDQCPKLFVRVDHDGEMALLPLDYRFEINPYRASNFTVFNSSLPKFGHLQTWGTTAQGVYRAGDTIDYKIWVRNQSATTQVPAPSGPYRLEIVDPTGQVAHRVDAVELSEFGAFAGRFEVATTAPVGWYRFRLSAGFDDWSGLPMQVLVSDFTPASFRVSTRLDGDRYIAGTEVTAEAAAELFSGGPYRDAEARITATLSALSFRPANPVAAGFRFDGENRQATLELSRQAGAVDADGRVRQSFVIPEDLGNTMSFASLRVEGAVRDERGRYVASTAQARVLAVDRIVGLRASRWIFSEDEPAEIESIVVDAGGNPVAGTRVDLVIERLETRASRVRGAGNAFLTEYIDEWIVVAGCDAISGTAPVPCRFVPADPGRYRVTARIRDTAGRAHATALTTWVQGAGRVVWNSGNDDTLDVVPEQTAYRVGDTARYLVQNPYPGARALVTIERYGIVDQWVETFETSTPVVEFEVGPDYLPGFYLSILVMSPRVDAPLPEPGALDLGKPAFRIAYVSVPVADPWKSLDIEVETDRASYRPRATVEVGIHAEPANRESREPIEVAVIVLDEAVLDLIAGGTEYFDPYAGFNRLGSLDLRNYGLLTRLVGRQRIELKGANPGGDGGAALSMRSLFRFVAHFEPSVRLDRRGRASFSFELPDNLTGWRVLVLGTTPTDRFGLGQAAFTVTQPTEIRPVMPNQVAEGDSFHAGVSVMNRTDQARVLNVRIEADGDLDAPAIHEETLALAPFERGEVRFPLTAARLPITRDRANGTIRFAISARDASDGDGLIHELPVRKLRVLQSAASFGTLSDATASEPLAFPTDILADAGEVGVELFASVIGNVDGAFRAAREYDTLFWEQQLTKAVMASHYGALAAYTAPDFSWPEAATLTDAILSRAASYQAPNGGMAWLVPRDEYVSPYLSAYTALAFAWLQRAGHAVPTPVETRLLAYLDTLLRRDVVPDFYTRGMSSTVRAVALAALAERGRLTAADLSRYREHVDYMSLFGKAHFLLAASLTPGGESMAAELGEILMQSSIRSAGKLSFNERLDDGYTRILATPLRTQCAALSALTRAPAAFDGAAAFALVRTITQSRGNRAHWENAQENMFCMNALIDYASRFENEPPAIVATAAIDGESLGEVRFDDFRDPAAALVRPIAPADPGARRELAIEAQGPGLLYYAARMSYAELPGTGPGVNAGIDVRRELSVERDGAWVLLDDLAEVAQGELVRVDLFVSLPTARHFVMVEDPVPGGLEPVNRDLANTSVVDAEAGDFRAAGGSWFFRFSDWRYYAVSRYSFHHLELRHDAARFYSDYLPPGNYLLSYTAQAIAGGSFSLMPATAAENYDPDVYGQSGAGRLTVTPR